MCIRDSRYKNPKSRAGFVELAPAYVPTAIQLYKWLENCKEHVVRVEWQSSKTSQNNIGNHVCENNIKVYPRCHTAGSATDRYVEFEITRNAHMSENARCPYTVTVMFKDPIQDFIPHAWAILRHVCKGKELFPDKVEEWMQDALRLSLIHISEPTRPY